MQAQISTASWIHEQQDRSEALRVSVLDNGDITVHQNGEFCLLIQGKNLRECYWLVDALAQAGELSKKRPLS